MKNSTLWNLNSCPNIFKLLHNITAGLCTYALKHQLISCLDLGSHLRDSSLCICKYSKIWNTSISKYCSRLQVLVPCSLWFQWGSESSRRADKNPFGQVHHSFLWRERCQERLPQATLLLNYPRCPTITLRQWLHLRWAKHTLVTYFSQRWYSISENEDWNYSSPAPGAFYGSSDLHGDKNYSFTLFLLPTAPDRSRCFLAPATTDYPAQVYFNSILFWQPPYCRAPCC